MVWWAVLGERLHLLPPFRRRVVEVPFGLNHPMWVVAGIAELPALIGRTLRSVLAVGRRRREADVSPPVPIVIPDLEEVTSGIDEMLAEMTALYAGHHSAPT